MKQVSSLSKNYSYLQFMPGENIARIHPPNCLLSNCSEKIPEFESSKNIIWPAFLAFWPTVRRRLKLKDSFSFIFIVTKPIILKQTLETC